MTVWLRPNELQQLVDCHKAALEIYAAQWCDDAEDCVQEAFLKLVRQRQRPDRPIAWLFRVVRNIAISHRRSANRRKHREQQSAQLSRRIDAGDSPFESLAVGEALANLDDVLRQVIIAKIWGGLTFHEIAELLGISASTAHRHFDQALYKLKTRLGSPCLK